MAKTIVMCPPTHFDVQYELSTNRWMDMNCSPDKNLASRQWLDLFGACLEYGLKVLLMKPRPVLPDMTFVANVGLQIPGGKGIIISNYFHPERRPESNFTYDFFCNFFTAEDVWQLPSGMYFEGQGDSIWLDERRVVIGYGVRTNLAGIGEVRKILKHYDPKIIVIPLRMKPVASINPDAKIFYHLDTCLFWLSRIQTFIVYEGAFMPSAIRSLKKLGGLMSVAEAEAGNFVCNGLAINEKTLFFPWIGGILYLSLMNLGYDIKVFPMSEFIKSGGAVKCLIMEI